MMKLTVIPMRTFSVGTAIEYDDQSKHEHVKACVQNL